jgi:hypothetical protein
MLCRMANSRVTISVPPDVAQRLRQCGSQSRAGASGYVARLVREDRLKEAVAAMERFHRRHPDDIEAGEVERVALAGELGETG